MAPNEEDSEVKRGSAIEWDVDMEVQLFYAMAGHKPVGINKHFHMACIWEKLSDSITKEISTEDIWRHLDTLYDIQMLDETESIPFPNSDVPFSLPDGEYSSLIKQKCRDAILADDSEDAPSPTPKVSTPKSSSRSGNSKDSTPKASSRKESGEKVGSTSTKTRKESGSSHASTDTPTNKSDKDFGSRSERRRDSRDSNASGPRESSTSRKSTSQKEKPPKSRTSSAAWDAAMGEEDSSSRRGRRRANPSTPPATAPAKRRRT